MPEIKIADEQAVKSLAAAIIAQTVKDWNSLVRDNALPQYYNGIRRFFKTEWASQLCDVLNLDPIAILEKLEDRRKNGVYQIEEE